MQGCSPVLPGEKGRGKPKGGYSEWLVTSQIKYMLCTATLDHSLSTLEPGV